MSRPTVPQVVYDRIMDLQGAERAVGAAMANPVERRTRVAKADAAWFALVDAIMDAMAGVAR